ncbi:pyridoxal phosphate-dependent aminotransferase [Candidatus Acetothermia bacterium]|nr:pyridoxal phosphate-dependent aminotransferase [Candidatus Acetothermia bacterium]
MKLAQRVESIALSQTLAVKKAAEELKRQGSDVIDLGPGEPDFATPEHIKIAAKRAIDQNFTKYTAEVGIPELRQAIVDKYNLSCKTSYKSENVIVTSGAKQALYHIATALFEEGDEVIIPAPYWVSYPEQVRLNDAQPIIVETRESDHFRLKASAIERALSSRTRAVIINSPNNPTGATIEQSELEAIVQLAHKHKFFVVFDECYEHFLYQGKHSCAAEFDAERVIVVSSVSKSYAMTGWRIGWALGPLPIIQALSKIQSHSTSHPTSIAQHAAVAALHGDQLCLKEMLSQYTERRAFVLEEVAKIPGMQCSVPTGAFYIFPNISGFCDGRAIKNSVDFARFLLQEAHVAVVPGSAFGTEGYVRLSYATSMSQLAEGMSRVRRALSRVRATA